MSRAQAMLATASVLALALAPTACTKAQEAGPGDDDEGSVPADVVDTAPADDGAIRDPGDPPDVEPETAPVDAPADEGIEPPDVQPDIPCEPNCEGKVCGPDGCGFICGYCAAGTVCNGDGSECVVVCPPQCEGKVCGDDGCGGECQPGCDEDTQKCGEDGLCYAKVCAPDCTGKQCGDDGCGSSCGSCQEPKVCLETEPGNDIWMCQIGPCGVITAEGVCEDNVLKRCVDDTELVEEDCADPFSHPEAMICGWDPAPNEQRYNCILKGDCTPQCEGRECGPDGCDGACGVCPKDWECISFKCNPTPGGDCGSITQLGECFGDILWDCAGGQLTREDCASIGATCKWDAPDAEFDCVF